LIAQYFRTIADVDGLVNLGVTAVVLLEPGHGLVAEFKQAFPRK
jgi:hypothetical protein